VKRPKHGKNTIQRKRLHTQAAVRRRFRKVKVVRKEYVFGLGIILSLVAIFVLWRSPDFLTETQTDVRFFQISTGPTGSAYYSIGRQIATVVSRPPQAAFNLLLSNLMLPIGLFKAKKCSNVKAR